MFLQWATLNTLSKLSTKWSLHNVRTPSGLVRKCGKQFVLSKQFVQIIKKKQPRATLSICIAVALSTGHSLFALLRCVGRGA
jgi:hypothetical protein